MDISIHYAFLPQTDPEAALQFYRDTLGFEVRKDVGYQDMRWITVGPVGRPETSIVLHPPAVDPGITDDERRTILDLIATQPATSFESTHATELISKALRAESAPFLPTKHPRSDANGGANSAKGVLGRAAGDAPTPSRSASRSRRTP
jgi:catechol 2,3-dioxygenase-like lactoylglutathione lyase family enzyme